MSPSLRVAQAAVHQFGGAAGRAPGKVALFQQQHAPARRAGLLRHARAADAAADDDEVPGLRGQLRERGGARGEGFTRFCIRSVN